MLGIVNASQNSKTAKSAAGSAILPVPAGKANSHPGPYQTIIRAVLAATIFTEIPDPPPETDLTDLNNSNVAGAAAALSQETLPVKLHLTKPNKINPTRIIQL